ncbi:MAG: ExeA family protein [Syntrophobacteria bacterium]
MYRQHFGLQEKPFRNVREVFFSSEHREALSRITEGVEDRCGLLLLVGETGTGKTTICRYLKNHCGWLCAYINTPWVNEVEFLEKVNEELGICGTHRRMSALVNEVENHLLRQYRTGRPVVLFVDDAHRLPLCVLDQVLMLSNLQVSNTPLLQIVMIGQTEFLDTVCRPRVRSLNQRIGVRYCLRGMDRGETIDYISDRIQKAGCTRGSVFTRSALNTIWSISRGIPRLVNHLGELALMEAYEKGKQRAGRREVKQSFRNPLYRSLFLPEVRLWSLRTGLVSLGIVVALCTGIFPGLWYFATDGSSLRSSARTSEPCLMEQHSSSDSTMAAPKVIGWSVTSDAGQVGFVKCPITRPTPSRDTACMNALPPQIERAGDKALSLAPSVENAKSNASHSGFTPSLFRR